ncbi:hypothetical protein BH24ACT7_BH24ACT7_20310 [soil metagenome]
MWDILEDHFGVPMSQLGETIKRRRLALGRSRGQLATSLNTTATVVAALERGERQPDAATIERLARVLGVEPAELTGSLLPAGPDGAAAAATVTEAPPMESFDEAALIPVVTAEVAAARRPAATGRELIDAPTEAVPMVERQQPVMALTAPPMRPSTAPRSEPATGFQRFMETVFDPDRPYLFWVRTALTVILLLIGLRVLAWALPAFFDALGDILSTIESTNPTSTTFPSG